MIDIDIIRRRRLICLIAFAVTFGSVIADSLGTTAPALVVLGLFGVVFFCQVLGYTTDIEERNRLAEEIDSSTTPKEDDHVDHL